MRTKEGRGGGKREVGGVGSSRRGGSWQLGRRSWLGRERERERATKVEPAGTIGPSEL